MDEFGLLTLAFNGKIRTDFELQDYNNTFIDFKVDKKNEKDVNLNLTWGLESISKNRK
jgi:hypothetical protein